jgi:hypothetical protein
MALKSMSIDKLRDLHRQVEAAIHTQLIERRRELESELSKLARYDNGRGQGKMGGGGARGALIQHSMGYNRWSEACAKAPPKFTPSRFSLGFFVRNDFNRHSAAIEAHGAANNGAHHSSYSLASIRFAHR